MCRQNGLHLDLNIQRQNHVCCRLAELGLDMHKTKTVADAQKILGKFPCRLVIIHIDSTGKETENFCDFIRSANSHCVIIVLMDRPKLKIEEKLFDIGVNDVVTGIQMSAKALSRRIKAHISHTREPLQNNESIRLNDTLVDFERREVWCNGQTRRLPGILADLLKYFIDNPGRIISRDELLNSPIWADSICSSAKEGGKTFDVNMSKLRKIIEPDPSNPQIIKSVRGLGWKLAIELT